MSLSTSSSASLTYLITGASRGGIGYEIASTLAAAGHHVIITCRTHDKGVIALQQLRNEHPHLQLDIEYLQLDLMDFDNIERIARLFISNESFQLHCLINNAGANAIAATNSHQYINGIHTLWINNYLGHYHLTRLLLPVLQRTARLSSQPTRIVHVSSSMHRLAENNIGMPNDIIHDISSHIGMKQAYSDSKLGNKT